MFTYSVKWVSEIRKFHVAVMQQGLQNVQKSWCFANLNLSVFFAILVPVAVVIA